MKACICVLFMFITAIKSYAQPSYLPINFTSGDEEKTPAFYTTSGDSTLDDLVRRELNYLSATLLVSPNLYFYKSCGEDPSLDAFKITPKAEDHNIFFDIETPCDLEPASNFKANVIIRLSKQFAMTLISKYKLDITQKQEERFTDYITGYYLVKRCDFINDVNNKDVYKALFNTSEILKSTSCYTPSLKQGYTDGKRAIQRHTKITVRDLINQSMLLLADE
jgi:hypothetical protein